MSRIGLGLILLGVWLLWWGSASPANVLSGLAVIAILFVVVPTSRPLLPTIRIRPLALARLVGYFIYNIVTSNVLLSWTILSPRAQVHTGVLQVPLCTDDIGIVTMVANITALTPGSMVVQVDHGAGRAVLWVHVLTPRDPATIARGVSTLERRCIEALGSPEQIAAVHAGASPAQSWPALDPNGGPASDPTDEPGSGPTEETDAS